MKKEISISGKIFIFFLVLACIGSANIFWQGVILSCFWEWFIIPIFPLPELSTAAAVGIVLLGVVLLKAESIAVFISRFSEAYHNDDNSAIRDLMLKGARESFLKTVILFLIFLFGSGLRYFV